MKRQVPMGGRIINNGSVSADRPRPNSVAYTATKHAISGITKSCALDGRPFKIACGQVALRRCRTQDGGASALFGSLDFRTAIS